MHVRAIRELRVLLPHLEQQDLNSAQTAPTGDIVDTGVGDADWSRLVMDHARITGSQFSGTALSSARWDQLAITSCRFEQVNLSSARLTSIALDRVHFMGCQLSGIQVADSGLANVLFEDCRLDYATLANVRSAGPVAFVNCTLVEASIAGSTLDKAVFDDCRMTDLELVHTDLRGADLRNNALDTISGLTSLRGTTLTPHQLTDLSIALVKDLNLRIEA